MQIDHEHKGLIVRWAQDIRTKAPDLDFETVVYEIIAELWDCSRRFDASRGLKFTTLAGHHIRNRHAHIIGRIRGTARPWNGRNQSLETQASFTSIDGHLGLVDPAPGPLEQLIAKEEEENAKRAFSTALEIGGQKFTEFMLLGNRHVRMGGTGVRSYLRETGQLKLRNVPANGRRTIREHVVSLQEAADAIWAQLKAEQEAA